MFCLSASSSQKKRHNRGRRDGGKKEQGDDPRGAGYKDFVKENELFVKYYKV